MKKLFTGIAAGALAISIFSSSAFAAVTIDSEGYGFVGKGDVQSALGYNNKQLQDNAEKLVFTYESIDTYEIIVEWTTGEGNNGEKTHTVEHKRTATVSGAVAYNSRTQNQVSGFNLDGFSALNVEGVELPGIGDIFPGNSGHKVKEVNLVSSTSTLYVNGQALQ